MRALSKLILAAAVVAFGALGLVSCKGYSDQQATDRCAIEKNNNGACFTDSAYDACIECFTECGDLCVNPATSCPLSYTCPE